MTRDTKIGLLLGLVFIFIIAFLINGIPRIRNGKTAPPGTMVRNTPVGVGGDARRVVDRFNEQGRPRAIVPLPRPDGVQPVQPAYQIKPVDQSGTPGLGQPPVSPWPIEVPQTPGRNLMQVASDTIVPPQPLGTVPVADDGGPESPGPSSPVTAPPGVTIPGPSVAREETLTPAPSAWPKTHVVKEGDSLEAIAKRLYGANEGAKPSSITRIFEANKTILKSPDRISVGQKLTIPAPAGSGATRSVQPTPSPRPAGPAMPAGAPAQRVYTIQEGDSLWSIAEAKLGQGTRWKEILQLNAGTLQEEDVLEPGAALKLPAK